MRAEKRGSLCLDRLLFLLFTLTKHQFYANIATHSDDRLDANQGGKSERSLRKVTPEEKGSG